MSTLAVIGTAGGAGTSTLAAVTFAGLRHRPQGAPQVWTDGPYGLAERIGDDEVPAVDRSASIWDARAGGPQAVVALLERPSTFVVLTTPSTPVGIADAQASVAHATERFGDAVRNHICVAHVDVYRSGLPRRAPDLHPQVTVVQVPYERLLDAPGPVPAISAMGERTRSAVQRWLELADGALSGSRG